MRFSTTACLTAFILSTHVFAAPTNNTLSDSSTVAFKVSAYAVELQQSVDNMASSIGENLSSINSTAPSSSGLAGLPTVIKSFQNAVESFTATKNAVLPMVENPALDFTIEEIEQLIKVLEVYKTVLSTLEQTVDAVINAFFPGLIDFFKPFIRIRINVVDSFTTPFLTFYTDLVGTLSGSPDLARLIHDYIVEIKDIRDGFLLSF
ncbi:hypothetical protein BGW36DRAFT_356771 [Talaromyces proteolyticus]|uniref:Antigenic cell wall galactomannoprotein n=1 Tax=Talaromyces proteolyticus TaxID=1131652 RepID=A0AAD4KU98_9EURO|nr:uncharacterized protein BGW36DRAFT_356771 [Talaromyces proteolyticus]KAH8700096.1 hypothetical protein BGW36DRAFT_356771 [Talaromyces proteolyticus]